MLGLLCSKADEHQGRAPFITIPQSVCHPVGEPTEGPCFPGQVFNTQGCSCHQSGDSRQVPQCQKWQEKKDPESLRAQVLKMLGPNTPPEVED